MGLEIKQKINKIFAFLFSKITKYVFKYIRLFFIQLIIKILLFHYDYVRPLVINLFTLDFESISEKIYHICFTPG